MEKQRYQTFDNFKILLCDLHHLKTVPFVVKYADEDNDLLPITNDDNYMASLRISNPKEFMQVSAIIDVDLVPETCRRVKLLKHGSDKPLGFYIRDGTSVRVTPQGLEKVPGIFISRLVPGGLAESTGLLAVNDEVLEVNGIEVAGKSLDQVSVLVVDGHLGIHVIHSHNPLSTR